MYWKDHQGNIYGPYSKQGDGFPNAGEVVRYYREIKRMSKRELAAALGVHRVWIIRMENENKVPELISRRRAISRILGIPPVLLGISALGTNNYLQLIEESHAARPLVVEPYSLVDMHEYLDNAWDLFTYGSVDVLSGVRKQKYRIEEAAVQSGDRQTLSLLHRYEHFLLMVGRQKQDYAGTDPERLIDLAAQTNEPDALAISLYRRGKMHFQRHAYKAAVDDIRGAFHFIEKAGPQVKGVTLVGAGPVLAHHAVDQSDVHEILMLLEGAEKCLDPANGYPDPFRARFDESWYLLARASALIPLLRLDPSLLDEVFQVLDLAQQKTGPHEIRRKANIELLYADASLYAGEYLSSADTALEALELAQSVNSAWNIERIKGIYVKLTQTKIKNSTELRTLGKALATN
jgi:transcriptional regulator with XRE-family HTH domain